MYTSCPGSCNLLWTCGITTAFIQRTVDKNVDNRISIENGTSTNEKTAFWRVLMVIRLLSKPFENLQLVFGIETIDAFFKFEIIHSEDLAEVS